jgi:hypothetical protein
MYSIGNINFEIRSDELYMRIVGAPAVVDIS